MCWLSLKLGAAEKSVGYISRAQDADPYLAAVRDAVAREAQTYSTAYPEGSGPGLRYTAFERQSWRASRPTACRRHKKRLLSFASG